MIRRLIRLPLLLVCILVYTLGAGIADYLGKPTNWQVFIVGLIWLILCLLTLNSLGEYSLVTGQGYQTSFTSIDPDSSPGSDQLPPRSIMFIAFTCLAVLTSITALLINTLGTDLMILPVMGIGFLGGFVYYTPPLKLEASGYGELVHTFIVIVLIPVYSFLLQAAEINRLVAVCVFPLSMSYLAMLIAFAISKYQEDMRQERCTMATRMGWKNAMSLHNIMIFSAYIIFGISGFYSVPRFFTLLPLITLPLGLFEIWQMWRISQGGHPNWFAIRGSASVLFISLAGLITYAFWVG